MLNNPKEGDVIRWVRDSYWRGMEVEEYTLETYRYTLGFFESENHREAGRFTPLCDPDLWIDGPESREEYISNFGKIPAFEIIRK